MGTIDCKEAGQKYSHCCVRKGCTVEKAPKCVTHGEMVLVQQGIAAHWRREETDVDPQDTLLLEPSTSPDVTSQ